MKKVAMLSIFVLALATVASAQPVVIEKYYERLASVDPTDDNVRTMAVTPDGVLATIHRGAAADAIKLYQAEPGLPLIEVENLDMTGITPGTYNIVDGDFSDDGVFYACSLSYGTGKVLNVYQWATLDATPVVIFTTAGMTDDWMGYRLGDAVGVGGSESDNSVKIIISGNNALSQPLVLTTADNGASFSSATLASTVRAQDIDVLADGSFWATYAGGTVAKYNADGSAEGTALPADANPVSAVAVDETRGLVFGMGYNTGNYLSVWDIATATKVMDLASDPIDAGVGTISGYANGSAGIELVELAGGTYIYALSERNGIARYSLSDVLTVDGVGAGAYEYATIQGAIDSYCAGQANAGVTNKPLIIEIDPAAGPYQESLSLNDATIASSTESGGNIAGDIVIKSSTNAAKPVIKLEQCVEGTYGLLAYQNTANIIFKSLVFCPAITGATFGTDHMIKIDENSANTDFNWVEFYDTVCTQVDEAGDPFATDKASALVPDTTAGVAIGRLISSWGDAGESRNIFMEDHVSDGGGSYGNGFIMAGNDKEKVFIHNSMFVEGGYSSLRIGPRGSTPGLIRISGDDAGAGPMNCTYSAPASGHGVYLYASSDGVCKIDNFLVHTGDRGISGTGWVDLQMRDSIFNCAGGTGVIVDGLTNYPQYPPIWERCTFHRRTSGSIFYRVSGAEVLTIKDCVFTGLGATALASGTIANVSNTAMPTEGPYTIGSVGGTATVSDAVTADPYYKNMTDSTAADFMDIGNSVYGGAAVGGADLAGGADYVGDETWTILDNFEDGNIDGWAEETYGSRDANGSIAYTGDDTYDGAGAMQVVLDTPISGYDYAPVLDIPVSAGDQVAIKAYLKWLGDGDGLRIWGAWNDATNSYMSSAGGNSTYVGAADGWAAREYDFGEAPTGAAYFRLQVRVYGATVPATGYVDYVLAKMPAADAQPAPWGDYDFVSGDGSYAAGDTGLAVAIDNSDLINGLTGTIVSGGFHGASAPADDAGRLAVLTNGTWDANGLSVIVADAGTGAAALEVEYTLAESSDIEQIRIFSGHDGDGTRTFINAKVEVDTYSGYELLRDEVKAGYYGMPSPATEAVALAWLYDAAGGNIAENVEKVKISFYDVSHNSTGFMQKFDDNLTDPPVNYPNQGTIIKEVDIIGTSSAVNEWLHY